MKVRIILPYGGEGFGCFDPQRFISMVAREFPGAELDTTDWSAKEAERVEAYLLTSDASQEVRDTMRRQIKGKSMRMGPVYQFKVTLPSGVAFEGGVNRYRASMTTNDLSSQEECDRIRTFFSSVTLGTQV